MALDKTKSELSLLFQARYPLIYLVTHEEDRAEAVLRAAARECGFALHTWTLTRGFDPDVGREEHDPSRSPSDEEALDKALATIWSHPGPAVFAMLDLHRFLGLPRVTRGIRDLLPELERASAPRSLVVVAPELTLPEELAREAAVVDLPPPTVAELARALAEVLVLAKKKNAPKEFLESMLLAARGLTLAEARRAFRRAARAPADAPQVAIDRILDEKRQAIRKSALLDFVDPDVGLTSVGGLDELKRWLEGRANAFSNEARAFGLPQPKGMLLVGVQGCGKSLTAKAVARLWDLPLLRLDPAQLFAGPEPPEQRMRRAIRNAENLAPAVLWIDEIDKGFAGVSGEGEGGALQRIFGTLVTWLQEKEQPIFVAATANEIGNLPPELLRKGRFDEIFFIDLPSRSERLEILRVHLAARKRDPKEFDLEALADRSEGFAGAELEQSVVAGLYRAFGKGEQLHTSHIVSELESTVPLYATFEEKIKELREWARTRTRRASEDTRIMDLLEG